MKDNSITASIEDNDKMKSLRDRLEERERKRGLRLVKKPDAVITDDEADSIISQISRTA